MPHRVNSKGDIGTAKRASDSYDADNIYLSEEGWVYRHFKNSERTQWWDEILVAGQVKDGVDIHGVKNEPVSQTNPLKLGTDDEVTYETGDCEFDISYANLGGDPELAHMDDMESVIIDPNIEKVYNPGDSYRVPAYAQGVPDGWTHESDPSNKADYPDEPVYPGEDTFVAEPNEYTIKVSPLPAPGADLEPQQVVIGEFESGEGGGYTEEQVACVGGGGGGPAPPPAPTFDLEVDEGGSPPDSTVTQGEKRTYHVTVNETTRRARGSTTTFEWVVSNGTIVGSNTTDTVEVLFDTPGVCNIGCIVIMTNETGDTENNIQINVTVEAVKPVFETVAVTGPSTGDEGASSTYSVAVTFKDSAYTTTNINYAWTDELGNATLTNADTDEVTVAYGAGDSEIKCVVSSPDVTDDGEDSVSVTVSLLPYVYDLEIQGDSVVEAGGMRSVYLAQYSVYGTTQPTTHKWEIVSGTATISGTDTDNRVEIEYPDDTDAVIKVTVDSPEVKQPESAELAVTVNPPGVTPPVFKAPTITGDLTANEGGSKSYLGDVEFQDPANTTTNINWAWTIESGNGVLSNADQQNCSVLFGDENVTLQLTVSSDEVARDMYDSVDIVVTPTPDPVFLAATISGEAAVNEGDTKPYEVAVTFDGSQTTTNLEYNWTVESGSATLTNATSRQITAEFGADDTQLKCVVSSVDVTIPVEDTFDVTVTPTPPPVFNVVSVAGDLTADEGEDKDYTASVSFTDVQTTDQLEWQWELVSGAGAVLTNANQRTCNVKFGAADVELKVTVSSVDVVDDADTTVTIDVTPVAPELTTPDIDGPRDVFALTSVEYTAIPHWVGTPSSNVTYAWDVAAGNATLTNETQQTVTVAFQDEVDVVLRVVVDSPDAPGSATNIATITVASAVPTWKSTAITGPNTSWTGDQHEYNAYYDVTPSDPGDVTFTWSATTGDVAIDDPNSQTPKITFNTADPVTLQCAFNSITVGSESIATYDVAVTDAPPGQPTIVSVNIDGDSTPDHTDPNDNNYSAGITWTDELTTTDLTYQWEISGVAAGGSVLSNADQAQCQVKWNTEGAGKVKVTITSGTAAGTPISQELDVDVKQHVAPILEPPSIDSVDITMSGPVFAGSPAAFSATANNSGGEVDSARRTYQWTTNPTSSTISGNGTSSADITFDHATKYTVTCVATWTNDSGSDSESGTTDEFTVNAPVVPPTAPTIDGPDEVNYGYSDEFEFTLSSVGQNDTITAVVQNAAGEDLKNASVSGNKVIAEFNILNGPDQKLVVTATNLAGDQASSEKAVTVVFTGIKDGVFGGDPDTGVEGVYPLFFETIKAYQYSAANQYDSGNPDVGIHEMTVDSKGITWTLYMPNGVKPYWHAGYPDLGQQGDGVSGS